MTTATENLRHNYAAGVAAAVEAIRARTHEHKSTDLTGDDVRSALSDMCIEMQVSRDQLPGQLQHVLDIASSADATFPATFIVGVLHKSVDELFGSAMEPIDPDMDPGSMSSER
jgi:hypothetical protein